jgi:hypothetical protein
LKLTAIPGLPCILRASAMPAPGPHAFRYDSAAEEVHGLVVDVHVTAAATRQARLLAKQLGRHALQVYAACNRNVMRPVTRANSIVGAQVHTDTGRGRLLAGGLMHLSGQGPFPM